VATDKKSEKMIIKKTPQIGHPILRKKAKPVKNFQAKNIKRAVKNLIDTMRDSDLIGLAAPQLGRSLRIFITEVRKTKYRTNPKQLSKLRVYINPKIIRLSKETSVDYEGCGSVIHAQLFAPVKRPEKVIIEAHNKKGQKFQAEESGLLGRVIQHEYDHLEGILFTDKIDDWEKILSLEEYKKYKERKLKRKKATSIKSTWEEYYQKTPLSKIPWQKTQASYFTRVIESNKIKPGLTLDLGCGTGAKVIYLAKKGFKVTGVDISKTAIKHARENAKKAEVKAKFIVADATNLSFLSNKKFDFVLDWANLHGIPKIKRKEYVDEIIRYTKRGGKLLLRCFSKRGVNKQFVHRPMGTIYLFSKEDIKKLFGKHFKILETNKSKPFVRKERKPPAKWLDEYLMERL